MKYKVLPKIDQKEVFTNVFQRLNEGGCIGIFPEGGSHDQTKLLPLKPGVAIMALGAMEKNPDVPASAPDEDPGPGTDWRGIPRTTSQLAWRLDFPEAT